MAIQWRESLAIGIDEIDNQHKQLFEAIDKLFTACSQGKGRQEVANTINFLEDYTIKHFTDEENYHIRSNYPERVAHKQIHDKFLKNFQNLKQQFENEGPSIIFVSTINKTVVDWLINHIGQADKAFGEYMKNKK